MHRPKFRLLQKRSCRGHDMSIARPPHGPIRVAALMICTRDRPEALADCLASCARLERRNGLTIKICLADNNAQPQEEQIRLLGAAYDLDLLYDHEPKRGYASVRNRALRLCLAAGADAGVFIDDDSSATPGLVAEHVAALERYDADAILGTIDGLSRRPKEGRRVFKAGTGNVSIRRWVFDPEGAGLAFDPRLDLLGFEDWEFFNDLIACGGAIYQSTRAISISRPGIDAAPTSVARPYADRRAFAMMEGRNEVATTRIRHGLAKAGLKAARRHLPLIARGAVGVVAARLGSGEAGEAARLKLAKGIAGLEGLWRPGFERPLARLGELVEVDPEP